NISVKLVSREVEDEILTVHAAAKDVDGRDDEDLGSVAFPQGLRGEARANAILKCVTKAKRRVTLSICGLGFLDETAVDDIPSANRAPRARPNVMLDRPEPDDSSQPVAPAGSSPSTTATDAASAEPVVPAEAAFPEDDSLRLRQLNGELAAAAERGTSA